MNYWRLFLAHLQRGGSYGFWCFESTAHEIRMKHGLPVTGRDGKPETKPCERISVWWPVDRPAPLPKMIGPHGPRHFWFGVHPCISVPPTNREGEARAPKWVRSQIEYIAAVNCFYAEFDGKDFKGGKEECLTHVQGLAPIPSVIIDSGGGYQCYWLLDQPQLLETSEQRHEANHYQHAWVLFMGGDGAAKNLNRVLRVVGTKNVKDAYGPDFPMVEFVQCDMDLLYTHEQIIAAIPPNLLERSEKQVSLESYDNATKAAIVLGMLTSARCDDYRTWVEVGMALSPLGEIGFQLWSKWSNGSDKYKAGVCERKWKTFDPNRANGLDLGTIMRWAQEDSPIRYHAIFGKNGNGTNDTNGNGYYTNGTTSVSDPVPLSIPTPIIDPLLLFPANDEGNARAFESLYGSQFIKTGAFGWLYWTGTHWERELAEVKLRDAIIETLKARTIAAIKADNQVIAKAAYPSAAHTKAALYMVESHDDMTVRSSDFDNQHALLNVQNGVLDLRTGDLSPHSPEYKFTYCLDVPYEPKTDWSEWEDFLIKAVAGGAPMAEYLQRAVGYTLTGYTSEEVFWYIWGPERSGKGTFTETLLTLLGDTLSAEKSFSTFTRNREEDGNNFDLAGLKACRLVVAAETSARTWLNSESLKMFTGGSKLDCAFKHRDSFQYIVKFKIWTTSNEKPKADPEDSAFWSTRILVVGFPVSHKGKEDKSFKPRMKSPENLKAVLAWAVEGSIKWYATRHIGLGTPAIIAEATQAARYEIDYVQQWLEECTVIGDGGFTSNEKIHASYNNWCLSHAVEPKKQTSLSRSFAVKGFTKVSKKVGGKTERGWEGFRLKLPTDKDDISEIPF